MKLLLFYAHKWWFKTASKSLPDVADIQMEDSMENTIVVFYHVEKEDEGRAFSISLQRISNGLPANFRRKMLLSIPLTISPQVRHLLSSQSS
jgi:hypothetical protein